MIIRNVNIKATYTPIIIDGKEYISTNEMPRIIDEVTRQVAELFDATTEWQSAKVVRNEAKQTHEGEGV